MIILDTNVISETLKIRPSPAVLAWLNAQDHRTLGITTVTAAELWFGVLDLPAGSRRDRLGASVQEVFTLFATCTLPFDFPASMTYAAIRADARCRGVAISQADAEIAAIARAGGHDVATRSVAPFLAAGIGVINPFDGGTQ